jgi:hypothetical protein
MCLCRVAANKVRVNPVCPYYTCVLWSTVHRTLSSCYFYSRLITLLLSTVDYITFVHGWLHYFCSRLIILLLFAVDYITFVRGWLPYLCLRLFTLLLFTVDYITFDHGWLHYFCSRLITLLLFTVITLPLFTVDYITFVHGWLHYFCSRLITLLLFTVDYLTFVYGWLHYFCSRLIALRVGVECNVVRTQKNGDRAWCVIDPVRGVLRDALTHNTHILRKKEKERNIIHTHITYKHVHNTFIRYISLRHFL